MTTLTDRYVDATLRRLPVQQRPDIERELRSSIADAVDDRISAGDNPEAAETTVLTGLGDPAKLAASYSNRPLYLIGPDLFIDYTRVIKALLSTVVPIVVVVVAFVQFAEEANFGAILGRTIGAGITTAVNIVAWVTVIFAVLDRTGARWNTAQDWKPADLPAPPTRRARYGELIGETVATVVFSAFLLLSPSLGVPAPDSGQRIQVLDPWLWDNNVVYLFVALLVAALGFSFARHYISKWRLPLEIVGGLVRIAPGAILIWLAANDHIINPALIEAFNWDQDARRWTGTGIMIGTAIAVLFTVIDSIRRIRDRG